MQLCGRATPRGIPLPPSAGSERFSEADDSISVAPEYAEAISGLRVLKGPAEGKEEATVVTVPTLRLPPAVIASLGRRLRT